MLKPVLSIFQLHVLVPAEGLLQVLTEQWGSLWKQSGEVQWLLWLVVCQDVPSRDSHGFCWLTGFTEEEIFGPACEGSLHPRQCLEVGAQSGGQ
jgi:hypothetical protein